MALVGYRADSGERIESFSLSKEQWRQLRNKPIGRFLIGRERVPAVPTRSSRGLQYFARASGHGGRSEPESVEHEMVKLALIQGLRAAGYDAEPEHPGSTPDGRSWEADVFVPAHGRRIAFEVQLSRQHFDEYRSRTERYTASGVKCVWLVRSGHVSALFASCRGQLEAQGLSPADALNRRLPDMPCHPLLLDDAEPSSSDGMRVVVWPMPSPPGYAHVTLADFAVGVVAGRLRYTDHQWRWGEPNF